MRDAQTRVLFVDDDANLLQGMKRMLRPQRDRWDMTFVNSGAAALDAFADSPFDVIVSDMRMPEMDGAALLEEVSRRYPAAVRIVLSGFAENETVMRTIGPSHQYLAKPCDPDILVSKINEAMQLRNILDNEELRAFVTGLKVVPSSSSSYRALVAELNDPNASTNTIGDTIASDISLAAQTLKLTNSAYFSLPTTVTNCRQAVQFLGFDTIRSLVTVANFFHEFSGDPSLVPFIEALVKRSLEIGALSREIASLEGQEKPEVESALCAGMLAHIGTLVLYTNFRKEYEAAMQKAGAEGIPIETAEREIIGATHAELGAYLLGLWGFGFHIIDPISNHHSLAKSTGFDATSALHVAQFLTMKDDGSAADKMICATLDTAHLEAFEKLDRLEVWKTAFSNMFPEG